MLDHFLRDRAAAQRLRANPIGSHFDGFTAWLSQRGYAWTTIRQHVWALAAFGRCFLWQAGDIDRDLAAAIPPIRRWRLVEVPKYLQAAEVAHLLASVDRTSASGRRNYAILLLLARLGLRAGEVVRLELQDLDCWPFWRASDYADGHIGERAISSDTPINS